MQLEIGTDGDLMQLMLERPWPVSDFSVFGKAKGADYIHWESSEAQTHLTFLLPNFVTARCSQEKKAKLLENHLNCDHP